MKPAAPDDRSFLSALLGDGRPPLVLLALGLILAGLFALFLALTGDFLPHDEHYLRMTARELCAVHGCRIVHFMVHDRASFGGALIAVGLLYLWLVEFPLREGRGWAWWLLLVNGLVGFASFFAYLAYGYFDLWHGLGSLALFLCFVVGLVCSRPLVMPLRDAKEWRPASWPSSARHGRACLMLAALGMCGGGLTILLVGMTCVFVPEDLQFMGLQVEELRALNPRLVPLIAHDRAGFGGAIICCGVCMAVCLWSGAPVRSLWHVLALAGGIGFSTAIGVHPLVGYNDPIHLAPAVAGAILYTAGLILTYRPLCGGVKRSGITASLPASSA